MSWSGLVWSGEIPPPLYIKEQKTLLGNILGNSSDFGFCICKASLILPHSGWWPSHVISRTGTSNLAHDCIENFSGFCFNFQPVLAGVEGVDIRHWGWGRDFSSHKLIVERWIVFHLCQRPKFVDLCSQKSCQGI